MTSPPRNSSVEGSMAKSSKLTLTLSMLTLCKGDAGCSTLPRMRHQQSMPNLSRSTKLSLAASTPLRSIGQQPARGALHTRRVSAQPLATNSHRLRQTPTQPTAPSRVIASRQQAPVLGDFKTRAAREQSPSSSSSSTAKSNGTAPRQPSRLVAPSR